MQSYYPKRSPHSATRLPSNVMIMKILTTMRSNHIVISILYPLVKLMTLSLLLEMFELFITVFDKDISISRHFCFSISSRSTSAMSTWRSRCSGVAPRSRSREKARSAWLISSFKAPLQAERDVGARATKSRRGRLSMITWMSFQSCDKFELCDAVNLLTLWFGQSIGDYVVPDWHTEF